MGRSRNKRTVSPFEPRRRARRRALQALYQWQLNDDSAVSIIKQFLEEQNFEGVDAEYFQQLVRDVIAEGELLDAKLGPHVERIDSSLDQMERVILRIGAVELLKHPEIPYRVVIDEAVELAHRFGAEQGHSFVNGVLDRLARDLRPIEFQVDDGR
ncbi:MAG TPA: transcription antitermination factor NusB [Wenzhouxiangellaceae bacterium]|nr:transcription antitermination factor NusB [Wenzhouxiangellaceae bacterium]